MRRRLEVKHDRMVRNLFAGTTATNAAAQEPLTLDKIQRLAVDLRAKLGPTPVFLSSKLFPADKALVIEAPSENFTCAHPGFWARFQHEVAKNQVYEAPT